MGRFEKRPENPRIRGELSRAAENALWDVVEDLENLQAIKLSTIQNIAAAWLITVPISAAMSAMIFTIMNR